jgi:hypothetical protein
MNLLELVHAPSLLPLFRLELVSLSSCHSTVVHDRRVYCSTPTSTLLLLYMCLLLSCRVGLSELQVQQCHACKSVYCSSCSVINYDEREDRIFCLDCNTEGMQVRHMHLVEWTKSETHAF